MGLVTIVFAPGDVLERTVTINGERVPVGPGMKFKVSEKEADRLLLEGFQKITHQKGKEGE